MPKQQDTPSTKRHRVGDGTPRRANPNQGSTVNQLDFQDEGRTFTCLAESSPATPGVRWWWVRVSGDAQRYAAFRTRPDDTAASVQPRILAYYTQLLVERARPREIRSSWGRRPANNAGDATGSGNAG